MFSSVYKKAQLSDISITVVCLFSTTLSACLNQQETPTPVEASTSQTKTHEALHQFPHTDCDKGIYCFNFERTHSLPKVLISTGNVAVSTERAFAGDYSLKISATGGAYNRNFISLKLEGELSEQLFGRMMLWIDNPGGHGGDFTFAQTDGQAKPSSGAPAGTQVFYRYRIAGTQRPGTLMANYDTQAKPSAPPWRTDCWDHSSTPLPREAWACVEWQFNTKNNELRYWLNGEEVKDIHVRSHGEGCLVNTTQDGKWLAPQAFSTLHLGLEQYHSSAPARTIFIDEVVVNTKYIGCPEP